jgi:hypothetical protein
MAENEHPQPREPKPRTTINPMQAGVKTFWWTAGILLLLLAIYIVTHVLTLDEPGKFHREAADVAGDRQTLLVSLAMMEDHLGTPRAIASPATDALLLNLKRSVMEAESRDDVETIFREASTALTGLGVHEEISSTILDAAKAQAMEYVSASEDEKPVAERLFETELELAQGWILDALGAPAILEQARALKEITKELGYGDDSDVGQALAAMEQELGQDRPNRALVAEKLSGVADEIRGPRSLFWGHPALRWLEVVAWSLFGILAARLWSIGKYLGTKKFKPEWNWWWWANIVQAPLLAIGVVLALTYFELGVSSGETLGFKLSLQGQPIELTVCVSLMLGLFSDRAYKLLGELVDNILPKREDEDEDEKGGDSGGAG